MTGDPLLLSVLGTLLVWLIGLVGWFARHNYLRLEQELREEKEARSKDKERERMDHAIYRQAARDEINGVGDRLQTLRDHVMSECINHERMTASIKPVFDRLGEIRLDLKEIYERLERKQDR